MIALINVFMISSPIPGLIALIKLYNKRLNIVKLINCLDMRLIKQELIDLLRTKDVRCWVGQRYTYWCWLSISLSRCLSLLIRSYNFSNSSA